MALAKDRTVPSSGASFHVPTNMYDVIGSSLSPPPLIHFPNFTSLISPSPGAGFYAFHQEDHDHHHHQYQRQLGLTQQLDILDRHSYPSSCGGCDDDDDADNNKFIKLQQVVHPFLNNSPDLSSSSSANSSNGFPFHGGSSSTYPHHFEDQAQSLLINFKPTANSGFINPSTAAASFLNFEQVSDYNNNFCLPNSESYGSMWEGSDIHHDHQLARIIRVGGGGVGTEMDVNLDEVNGLQAASNIPSFLDVKSHDWLYGDAAMVTREDSAPESTTTTTQLQQKTCFHNKRALSEEDNMQTLKKPCTTASRKQQSLISTPKPSSSPTSSKDPQSVAAKNRRERISERLKILQDLVPNGSKVDLVTMLEKAISYVKFLQLQVKVLATDEFWPAAGGKLPDISQVKEAIDAILSSSQRDRRSSSPK